MNTETNHPTPPDDEIADAEMPAAVGADELATLMTALQTAEAKAAENLDGWQRARADFSNFKRRAESDLQNARSDAAGEVILTFLPVMDDLSLALQNAPKTDDPEMSQWVNGVLMVQRKLNGVFERHGVTQIEAIGQPFDPNQHEAVVQIESPDHESGTVIDVLREGYKLGERVIRPSMVRVAA